MQNFLWNVLVNLLKVEDIPVTNLIDSSKCHAQWGTSRKKIEIKLDHRQKKNTKRRSWKQSKKISTLPFKMSKRSPKQSAACYLTAPTTDPCYKPSKQGHKWGKSSLFKLVNKKQKRRNIIIILFAGSSEVEFLKRQKMGMIKICQNGFQQLTLSWMENWGHLPSFFCQEMKVRLKI